MKHWTLHFDGLCEPRNPGGTMAFGWLLEREGLDTESGHGAILARPENTNNVAEYLALFQGLVRAAEIRCAIPDDQYPGLLIRGDSLLVCNQIESLWRVNQPRLQQAHARCLGILSGPLKPYQVEWIRRDLNTVADELSRKGYFEATGKIAPERRGKGAA